MRYIVFLLQISFFANAQPTQIVISQVYGGGGNSGAPYTHDFIEIFNPGTQPVDLSVYSLQYGSATGTTWGSVTLSGVIGVKKYFLVQLAGGVNGTALPVPDQMATINMSATAGKVALVQNSAALSGSCPLQSLIVDFLGYGSANCYEVQASPSGSNTLAIVRKAGGCQDHENNSLDFIAASPSPKNSLSPGIECLESSLPVYFSEVNAKRINGQVEISWKSDSEYEVLSYTIEGSENGNSFKSIKEVLPLKNDGTQASYKLSVLPLNKMGFYRIRGLEINGTITYSKIIREAAGNIPEQIFLYPNPVRDELIMEIDNREGKEIHLSIYNSSGNKMEDYRINPASNPFRFMARVNHFLPGLYYIILNGRPAGKFIKH